MIVLQRSLKIGVKDLSRYSHFIKTLVSLLRAASLSSISTKTDGWTLPSLMRALRASAFGATWRVRALSAFRCLLPTPKAHGDLRLLISTTTAGSIWLQS